ncbi:MAG: arsenate reductase ArsC [Proteobacteria bacterium]|nr:arsenate reductase ArsC [Pseudomonadota bacterium]NOG60494.1 arsenate reductase ArsC [Pseudomonadota bacterium]
MSGKNINVLFLCTGNSARSIMAEALLQRWGLNRFNSFSAGSIPKGRVNPFAIELLQKNNFKTDSFRSKNWDEFAKDDAPKLDFVFTVCDNAANEVCPVWPGQPMSAHWGIEDPDKPELSDDEQRKLFQKAYWELDHRMKIFTSLPLDKLDKLSLQKKLEEIGHTLPEQL